MKKCPLCNKDPVKVIYYGLPHYLCQDDECSCLYGFFDFITNRLPYNGWLYKYECSYWIALFMWLFDVEDDEGGDDDTRKTP